MSSIDEIIEIYKRDVDVTLLDEYLKRTPEEQILALEEFERFREELRATALHGASGQRYAEDMAGALITEPVPIETDASGVIRVSGTRVPLDTIWMAFHEGATAEEIVQQYPSHSLADAYQVIGYCLRHADELQAYLARRSSSAQEIRQLNESKWPPEGIRARLLNRRHRQ